MTRLAFAALLMSTTFPLAAASRTDWPQWRGPHRNSVTDERGLLKQWPENGPRLLWKIDGLGKGWSSPIIAAGKLYITGDTKDACLIYAFDLAGNPVWKAQNGKAWRRSYPGARACCLFAGGRLYHMNAHGRLACFNAETGAELWSVDILERFGARNITWGISECLLADGPRVIVTPGGTKALMAALDAETGSVVWTTPSEPDDRPSHSSPLLFTLGKRRVITNCSGTHGFGVDADTGKLLWRVPLRNRFGVNVSTPIQAGDRVFYVTPYGERGRQYRLVDRGNRIEAILTWKNPIDTVTGSGVLTGGILFASGYRDVRGWRGIDWKNGRTVCRLEELAPGAAVAAEGRLYCLSQKGTVAILKPAGDALEVVSRFRLIKKRVNDAWAHPVLLQGRLYLRYHDTLWCYRAK